jgi:hypothetical protein
MEQDGMKRCITCPAFSPLPGVGGAGTCRAAPPSPLQAEHYFRGSSRDLPFGSFPVVGAFPLVSEDDFCMSHPGNRAALSR